MDAGSSRRVTAASTTKPAPRSCSPWSPPRSSPSARAPSRIPATASDRVILLSSLQLEWRSDIDSALCEELGRAVIVGLSSGGAAPPSDLRSGAQRECGFLPHLERLGALERVVDRRRGAVEITEAQ